MSKYIKEPEKVLGVGRQKGGGILAEALRRRLALRACPLWKVRELALGVIEFIIKFRDNTKVLLFYVMGLPYLADGINKRMAFA